MAITKPTKVRELQRNLYKAAKTKTRKFYSLYDKVCRKDVIWTAWNMVRENKGCGGVDGQRIEDIEKSGRVEEYLETIRRKLMNKAYQPEKVLRKYIPKPSGDKRPLGIPTITDRIVQQAVRLVIEPIFEAGFEDCSYGFRPKRSPVNVAKAIRSWVLYGCEWVIDADLKSYFDTIPHDKLLKLIGEKISDGNILKLVKGWLKAGIIDGKDVWVGDTGTPQGGVISPLLSNIYLDQLDKFLKQWYKKGYDAHLVRYADDFVIFVRHNPQGVHQKVKEFVTSLGLTLNEEKTRIVHVKDGFTFLGVTYRKVILRSGKKFLLSLPSKESLKRIRGKVKRSTGVKVTASIDKVIEDLNVRLRGWANYFAHTQCYNQFDNIHTYVCNRLRKLRQKRRHKRGFCYWQWPNDFIVKKLGLIDVRKIRTEAFRSYLASRS